MRKLNTTPTIEHTLIHTNQNYDYELNRIFFEDLDLKTPDVTLSLDCTTLATRIASMLTGVESALKDLQPDAVLILGDTYSCLSAIIAKSLKIPVFHMEAGNRCFDDNVPEEINRRLVDHISDVNLPYSSIAREYLLKEGLPPDRVIKTGSPMREVLMANLDRIDRSNVVNSLNLKPGDFILCSIHRAENVDSEEPLRNIFNAIVQIADLEDRPVIVSTHPRTRKRLLDFGINIASPYVRMLSPLSFSDYNSLQRNAKVVLSDSGTISEESSILGFKALNIRTSHERPEAMESAMSTILTGTNTSDIVNAFKALQSIPLRTEFPLDYQSRHVSEKIVKIIMSYTHYVQRNVYKGDHTCI
jgi:UDP-N-acetylglucosamine 2-epimerase (non-hydrolysing)